MYNARYFCLVLSKFGFSKQIFVEVPTIKFHGNPSNGNCADAADRQTDGHEEGNLGAFLEYANAPNNKRIKSYVKIVLLNLQQVLTVIIASLNTQPWFSRQFVRTVFFCMASSIQIGTEHCISYL